jgi:hypothetical protein
MNVSRAFRCLFTLTASVLAATPPLAASDLVQPVDAPQISIDELRAGQKGVVWTVFQGTEVEPFSVEITGVIRNALGPGKSLILCQLTDERVQKMGAVAGMSGSPLYVDGKLAGALSYQIQRFETVRYAGFTPIADLLEVSQLDGKSDRHTPGQSPFLPLGSGDARAKSTSRNNNSTTPRAGGDVDGFSPLTPMFALGGIAPRVASLFSPQFQEMGLNVTAIGGYTTQSASSESSAAECPASTLSPGSAVAVALATGDVTLAGTGTVSHVSGNKILAFGHPMMALGNVELPMAAAEIIAILPSSLNSFKISNTGRVIGTITQDRLSAIYGEVGRSPDMLPIQVTTPTRTLKFKAIRHDRLTPMIAALGLSQAVLGSNENGLAEGFRIVSTVVFPGGEQVANDSVYAGPQGFGAGLDQFIRRLAAGLRNPIADVFPSSISFAVEPLARNPVATLDIVQVSRSRIRPGEELTATLTVRDYQGAATHESVTIPIPATWTGKKLEVLVTNGDDLDRLSGRPDNVPVSQIRDFAAYLDLMHHERRSDGVYVAVVERATAFLDQTQPTLDYPGSVERIARSSDDARFQKREVLVPLWERHVLSGRLVDANVHRALQVND